MPNDAALRHIVITGATDGIGQAALMRLAKPGRRIVLVGRDDARCRETMERTMAAGSVEWMDYVTADLSRISETQRAAEQIRNRCDRVDCLVHSAGGAFPKRRVVTEDGLELSFALQYLSRFALTEALIDRLEKSPDPRVLAVAGGGTWSNGLDLDDLQSEKHYNRFGMIRKASATNDLLTLEQIRRYPRVRFINYGPGMVRTKALMGDPLARVFFSTAGRLFSRDAAHAAADIETLIEGNPPSGFYRAGATPHSATWAEANGAMGRSLWRVSAALIETAIR